MVWNIVAIPNLKKLIFSNAVWMTGKKKGRWSILPDKEDKKF